MSPAAVGTVTAESSLTPTCSRKITTSSRARTAAWKQCFSCPRSDRLLWPPFNAFFSVFAAVVRNLKTTLLRSPRQPPPFLLHGRKHWRNQCPPTRANRLPSQERSLLRLLCLPSKRPPPCRPRASLSIWRGRSR